MDTILNNPNNQSGANPTGVNNQTTMPTIGSLSTNNQTESNIVQPQNNDMRKKESNDEKLEYIDQSENPFFQEPEDKKKKNVLVDILQSVVIALSLSIFLYLFILTPNQVDGPSMEPNFYTGQLLFTSKLHQWFDGTSIGEATGLEYNRGDVIVFQKPGFI
ncbi:MAG: S26 family signal peptidase [Candidatus Dojkabacteria bacterium]|nr:S26 family signal peptidase [Candidatus Dojkabacteria bacterium]